jgi:RNA polymerase-binding transcription factor DksA
MAKAEPKNSLPKAKTTPVAAKAPSPKKPTAVKQAAAKQVAPKAAKAAAPAAKKAAPKPAPAKAPPAKKAAAKAATLPVKKAAPPAPAKKEVAKKELAKKEPATKAVKKVEPTKKAEAVKAEPVKKAPPRKSTVICPLSGFEVKPDRPGLSPRTTERLRVRLLDERMRHLAQADQLQAEAKQLAQDRDEGDTQFDEEGGEGDTISVERERDLMLSASNHQIVDDIDRALERIKTRTYGLCTPAGRRISVERLEALPYAETCVDCKARAERRR